MPYIRLYSRDVPLEQKRVIARQLIDVTLHALQLRPEDRNRITIQFVPQQHPWGSESEVEVVGNSKPLSTACTLEVSDHALTDEKKNAFVAEAASVVAGCVRGKTSGRIARLLGSLANPARQVAFQFHDLDTASSGVHWQAA